MLRPEDHMPYLQRALNDGLAEISSAGRRQRIHYVMTDHSALWSNPEEKVRATAWAELIYKYEYSPERIGIEVTVAGRNPAIFADLVIYEDDANLSPYLVLECKPDNLSDAAFDQAVEQSCGYRASLGARYCGVVAGNTRRLLRFDVFPPGERYRNIMTDIPVNYGEPPEWRFLKGVPGQDLVAVSKQELRAAIRKCHQTLWEGGRRSPIVAFGEFCKLVFIKYRDETNLDLETGQPYGFQRRIAEINAHLTERIKRMYAIEHAKEPHVFTESINIDENILAQCVEHIEAISFSGTELDTKGLAFEEFMDGFFKGDFGQYFTPREIISFAVEMLQPNRNNLVLDPACGSGGFLLYALDYVRREANTRYDRQTAENFRYWHDFAQNNLFGIEVNEELARVAKMNMIIHDDGHTNIVGHDALDFAENIQEKNPGVAENRFDVVLTNPPFGSTIRRSEKGEEYLQQFGLKDYLGRNFPNRGSRLPASVKSEILFLERVHTFLKPGTGVAAVVLPDGVLTNPSLRGVRHWLLEHFQLLAVVSLPQHAFSHYDAGVKASIIFVRRRADTEVVSDEESVFMALADNIGYDATGRETAPNTIDVESIVPGSNKVEIHKYDLLDYRVWFRWETTSAGEADWVTIRREVVPESGLVAQWREFQDDPESFYV